MSCKYCEDGAHIIHDGNAWVYVAEIATAEPYYALTMVRRGIKRKEEWTPIRFCPMCGRDLREVMRDER